MYDVIIIGGGISGLTSAIYLKRYGINVLVLEKNTPGGILNTIPIIENYPGFDKIEGPKLAFNTYKKVKDLGIEIKKCEVLDIIDKTNKKVIITNKGEYKTKFIVIASGRIPKKLGVENEDKLIGNGISYCATCDGPLYKDKDIIVVGGGNSAIIESNYLSTICKSVTMLVRNNSLRADNIYRENLKDNIKILYNTQIKELGINYNKLDYIITDNDKKINTDCLFVFIGNIPSNKFIEKLNITNVDGYIKVDKNMKTNVDGIYAIGDVIEKDLYQIVTGVSEGAIAAFSIKEILLKNQ